MKKVQLFSFAIGTLLFMTAFITSCNGQTETDSSKSSINQPSLPNPLERVLNPADKDPYFTETKAIANSSGPKSITRNIMQDRNGDFWLATWEGIIHYDGKTFTNITNKEGLRRYHVFSVFEDSAGNLWFGTIGAGVYRYDGKTFTNFTTAEGLAHNSVGCMMEDKSGNIWFGTMDGASKYDGASFRNFRTEDGLSNNDVNSIIEDKTGRLWFGTRGEGVCYYEGDKFHGFKNKEGQPFNQVRCIIEDKSGHIWLGGNDGLWRYDGNSLTNYTTHFVGYIYEDKKGYIWTSSEGDNRQTWVLSRYDKKPLPEKATATVVLEQHGMFFGILEDKEGNIWLGSGEGVCRYDGKVFEYFKH